MTKPTSKLTDSLTTIFTGCCTALLIWIGKNTVNSSQQVLVLHEAVERIESNQGDLQNSFNSLSTRFSGLSDEQIRQRADIFYIKQKMK